MDVHPPSGSIHTWKDFLLHLLTITIGLFIALMLEAAVESLHHRHVVRDTRANLHREIQSNHTLYAEDVQLVQLNRKRLARDIEQLRNLRNGAKVDKANLSWEWAWNSFSDISWRSARDSGAVLYMTPDVIEGYSEVYGQQGYVNETAINILRDESKAGAPLEIAEDPTQLSSSEIEMMLISTAELDKRLGALQATMRSLDGYYIDALKHR